MEEQREPELAELTSDYYAEDPQLGDIVFLKHNFEDSSLRSVITGLKRTRPQRGLEADKSYEVVLYQGLKIKVAGLKEWLRLDDSTSGWEITDTLRGAEYNKLEPTVVVESIFDENQTEEE
jgi:hypothetical protein